MAWKRRENPNCEAFIASTVPANPDRGPPVESSWWNHSYYFGKTIRKSGGGGNPPESKTTQTALKSSEQLERDKKRQLKNGQGVPRMGSEVGPPQEDSARVQKVKPAKLAKLKKVRKQPEESGRDIEDETMTEAEPDQPDPME
ncbi:hypothetical protein MMC07_003790 [Pseudocyphellaria aurata]|nr:hypothetical protein [Pseudocyphellaria aurata]